MVTQKKTSCNKATIAILDNTFFVVWKGTPPPCFALLQMRDFGNLPH